MKSLLGVVIVILVFVQNIQVPRFFAWFLGRRKSAHRNRIVGNLRVQILESRVTRRSVLRIHLRIFTTTTLEGGLGSTLFGFFDFLFLFLFTRLRVGDTRVEYDLFVFRKRGVMNPKVQVLQEKYESINNNNSKKNQKKR